MNHSTLSSVTLATIENYRHAANEAARAYQLGSQRLVSALNNGIEERLYSRTSKFAPKVTSTLSTLRARTQKIVVSGIDEVTARTGKAVDMGCDGAAKQVSKAADFIAGIDNTTVANSLQTVARLSLPTAKLGLTVSGKLAQGAKALSTAAAGKGQGAAVQAEAPKVVRRAKRQTVASTKAVSRSVNKTVVRAKRKLA